MRRGFLFATALAMVLTACGSDDGGSSATTAAGAATTGGTTASDCITGDGAEVVVEATEFEFNPPCVVVTGDQSLVVRNGGSSQHTATIENPGAPGDLGAAYVDSELAPGDQFASEAVGGGIPPGTYVLYCRFHRDSYGMQAEVQITA